MTWKQNIAEFQRKIKPKATKFIDTAKFIGAFIKNQQISCAVRRIKVQTEAEHGCHVETRAAIKPRLQSQIL